MPADWRVPGASATADAVSPDSHQFGRVLQDVPEVRIGPAGRGVTVRRNAWRRPIQPPVPLVSGVGYLAILTETDVNGMDQLKADLMTCLPIALKTGALVGAVLAIFPAIVLWDTESVWEAAFAAVLMFFITGIPFAAFMEMLLVIVLTTKRNFRNWRRGAVNDDP
jgi:hypothetical protein